MCVECGECERDGAVDLRVKTHPAIASQEHSVLHNRGRNDADPHGEGVGWLFAGYSLAVRWLFVGCSLAVRWLFVGCSLAVRWLFVGCSLAVRWLANPEEWGDDITWTLVEVCRGADLPISPQEQGAESCSQ